MNSRIQFEEKKRQEEKEKLKTNMHILFFVTIIELEKKFKISNLQFTTFSEKKKEMKYLFTSLPLKTIDLKVQAVQSIAQISQYSIHYIPSKNCTVHIHVLFKNTPLENCKYVKDYLQKLPVHFKCMFFHRPTDST